MWVIFRSRELCAPWVADSICSTVLRVRHAVFSPQRPPAGDVSPSGGFPPRGRVLLLVFSAGHGGSGSSTVLSGKRALPPAASRSPLVPQVYVYGTTILSAADQYTDLNTTVLMYATGYAQWGAAVACYAGSLAMQVLVAVVAVGCRSGEWCVGAGMGWLTLAGLNLESAASTAGGADGAGAKAMLPAVRGVAAARFLTESLPQAAPAYYHHSCYYEYY